ncbi:hypothetical protein [Nonomuraea longicatena]
MSAVRRLRWRQAPEWTMGALTAELQDEVLDALRPLLVGPIPPEAAVPDPDAPGIYHVFTAHLLLVAGVYDDVVDVLILRHRPDKAL